MLEKQQLENAYQNQLLQTQIEVQEQSFKYFSEEIHDNIGQLLSIVKMQLYNIRSNSKEQETVTKAGNCTDLLGKAITDLRNVSHTFNTGFVSNAGLSDAIEKDMEYIRSAKNVTCALHISGDEYSLGSERELLIFRIVQEAINNALKHAAPTVVDIYLEYDPVFVSVTIADNGTGFEVSKDNKSMNGIGLSNMYMRADLLKGILNVSSGKNEGTKINLVINKAA